MPRTRSGRNTNNIAAPPTSNTATSTRISQRSSAPTLASPPPPFNPTARPPQPKRRRCENLDTEVNSQPESHFLPTQDPATNQLSQAEIDLTDLPTLENYSDDSTLQKWPPSRCREALAILRPTCNKSASVQDKAEISSVSRKYQHLMMLVALASKLTLQTVHREVGQTSPKRAHSAYVNYLEFSNKSHTEPMPQPNSHDPEAANALIARNKVVGHSWKALSTEEQAVFSSHLLHALAGIPDYSDFIDHAVHSDNPTLVPEVVKLSDDEEQKYRAVYNRLVNHNLVVERLGSHKTGPSDGHLSQKALQCVLKHQDSLRGDANRHPFDYWMVVSSNLPVMTPNALAWCRVFTSLPVMTTYVTNKASFPFMFASVSQGAAILNAVGEATGTTLISAPAPPPPARVRSGDLEKKRVRGTVTDLLIKALGHKPSQGLPQGEDPAQEFIACRVPVRMVLDPGATLKDEELKRGFIVMGVHGRRKWASDVEAGLFHFVRDDSILPAEVNPSSTSRGMVRRLNHVSLPDESTSDTPTSDSEAARWSPLSSDSSQSGVDEGGDSDGSHEEFEEFHGFDD